MSTTPQKKRRARPSSSTYRKQEVRFGARQPRKNSHERNLSAKQLKCAWIQTRKIKSKWKAEKRREGIQLEEIPPTGIPVSNAPGLLGQKSDDRLELTDIHTGSDASPSRSEGRPVTVKLSNKEPIRTTKTGPAVGSSQQTDRRLAGRQWHPGGHQGKKPSMRSRMNALLEKIQRENG